MQELWYRILDFIFPPQIDIALLAKSPLNDQQKWPFILSYYKYQTPIVKKALRVLKNRPIEYLISHFSDVLMYCDSTGKLSYDAVVVPVPIHRSRYYERGYNQSELLGRKFATKTGRKFDGNILCKKFKTKKQALISNREERRKNVLGSFALHDNTNVVGKNFIIVDDITTTGSTIIEIRRVLISAGATKVHAITVAH